MISSLLSQIQSELQPKHLIPNLTAGALGGLLAIINVVALASLVFSGGLSSSLSVGLGAVLLSTTILNIVIAFRSSFPVTISTPQNSVAAICALMAAAVAERLAGSSAQILPTALATIASTALLMGVIFFLLGRFQLGGWIRFIPYPVVGGFLSATGLLLITRSITMLSGVSVEFKYFTQLIEPNVLWHWLPGVAFALILLFSNRRFKHFLVTPVLLIVTIVLFYITVFATNTSIAQISAEGWLLGPFPSGGLWQPLTPTTLAQVNWGVVAEQSGNMLTSVTISAITLLLNSTGIELAAHRDIDLNRELRAAGIANLISGLGSGMGGYQTLSISMLGYRMGAKSRVISVLVALFAFLTLIFGAALLTFIPKIAVGGVLIFLGFDFLYEWVYESRKKLPIADYMLVILILLVGAFVGFLQGVILGVVIAAVLFVVNYSRINVVRNTLTGLNYRSNVDRSPKKQQLLLQRGEQIYILRLQGFLFFGTVNALLDRVRTRIKDRTRLLPKFLVLDFRLVNGVDSSAVLSFTKLKQIADENRLYMVFTGVQPDIQAQLKLAQYVDDPNSNVHFFENLDEGMDWCEKRTLAILEMASTISMPLDVRLGELLSSDISIPKLMNYLEKTEVKAGTYVIRQDSLSDEFYIVESGEVTILLERKDGSPLRLRTMGAGTVVGEVGFYTNSPRNTSVVADQDTSLYRLTKSALEKMHTDDPALALALHQFVIRLLAERLGNMNRTVQALLE